LKVAIFTGNYNHIRDGVSLTLNRLVGFLTEKGVEVLVFGPTIDQPAIDHVGDFISVPSVSLPGRAEYRLSRSFPKDIQDRLEKFDPDLIHIATPDYLGFRALKWAVKKEKPIVASYHTHFSSYLKYYKLSFLEPLLWKYLAWFYGKCIHVYVPSESMVNLLEEWSINSELKIWARGIEKDCFGPSFRDAEWRAQLGVADNDLVITFVSRLVWEKNLKLFAEVVNKLQRSYPNLKALIVGDGPALEGTKEIIPQAIFTGFLKGDELAKAYAGSDIFFFPSDTETFGNVTLEAMASGLPCVVADATGSRSLVDHGVSGFVIPVERSDKFYTFIEELINDESLRLRMSESAIKKADAYSWQAVNNHLLTYYTEVLELKKLD
jgi:glycosyltransferase involved in cell wall biosynthesis